MVDSFVKSLISKNIILFGSILLGFFILEIFKSDIKTALTISAIIAIFILAGFSLGIYYGRKKQHLYYSFELEICEDRIIRKGEGFNKIELKFDDIGRILMKSKFLVILKKGFDSNMTYYSRKVISIYDYNIIVIPNILEDFHSVKRYIEQKKNDI